MNIKLAKWSKLQPLARVIFRKSPSAVDYLLLSFFAQRSSFPSCCLIVSSFFPAIVRSLSRYIGCLFPEVEHDLPAASPWPWR